MGSLVYRNTGTTVVMMSTLQGTEILVVGKFGYGIGILVMGTLGYCNTSYGYIWVQDYLEI